MQTLFAACLAVSLLAGPALADGLLVGDRQRVVLFGDSITAPGQYGQIIQDLVDAKHPDRRVRVLSRGRHGDRARSAHNRIEEDVLAWNPDWVVLNFGINDARRDEPEAFLQHYESLIDSIIDASGARLVIASPLYPDRDNENARLEAYAQGLRDLAERKGALYAPIYETVRTLRPSLPEHVRYAPDSIHPNRLGAWMMAQVILETLGYDFASQRREVELIAERLTGNRGSEAPSVETFDLALPMPLRVRLVDWQPPQAHAPAAPGPVTLDGKLDEWDLSRPIALDQPRQHAWGVAAAGAQHMTATAWAMHRPEAIYFAIEVNDPWVRQPEQPRNVVSRDCVELCFDLRSAEDRAAKPAIALRNKTEHAFQLVLAPAAEALDQALAAYGNGDRRMLDGLELASAITPGGYRLEVRLPASLSADGAFEEGQDVGFDFAVVDVDRQYNYLSAFALRWTGSPYSAFSTREFGRLRLEPDSDP